MKKLLRVLLILFSTMMLISCKEYKHTKCDSCGKVTNCYKVTWVRPQGGYEESHFVCSKQCEDAVSVVLNGFAGMKKK